MVPWIRLEIQKKTTLVCYSFVYINKPTFEIYRPFIGNSFLKYTGFNFIFVYMLDQIDNRAKVNTFGIAPATSFCQRIRVAFYPFIVVDRRVATVPRRRIKCFIFLFFSACTFEMLCAVNRTNLLS